jgi:hypothetical protein
LPASPQREDNALIERETRVYLRDCQDHAVQALDLMEGCRDMSGTLVELLLGTLNTQMLARVLFEVLNWLPGESLISYFRPGRTGRHGPNPEGD